MSWSWSCRSGGGRRRSSCPPSPAPGCGRRPSRWVRFRWSLQGCRARRRGCWRGHHAAPGTPFSLYLACSIYNTKANLLLRFEKTHTDYLIGTGWIPITARFCWVFMLLRRGIKYCNRIMSERRTARHIVIQVGVKLNNADRA